MGMGIRHQSPNASEKIDSFPGRLFVFRCICAIFCAFCLVVLVIFVYLQSDSTEAEISTYGR